MLSKAYENQYDIALPPLNPSNGEFAILWFKPPAKFVCDIAYVIVSFVDAFKYRLNRPSQPYQRCLEKTCIVALNRFVI